jgi:hypothetical protein
MRIEKSPYSIFKVYSNQIRTLMRFKKSPYPIFKLYSNQIRTLMRFEKSPYSISKYQQQSKDPSQGFTALKAIHRNHEFYPSGLLTHFFSFKKTHPGTCLYHNHTHSHNQSAQWSGLQIIHTSLACKTNPGTCWIIHTITQSINQSMSQHIRIKNTMPHKDPST